jgi:hypothetical protein
MRIKTFIISMMILFLGAGISLLGQDTVTVNATIRGVTVFTLDGTDAGGKNPGDYSTAETCDFGTLDAIGGAITGGDALVTGLTGLPVNAAGADLSGGDGIYDPLCVGSFYPIFVAVGAPSNLNNHTDAALGIYAHATGITNHRLDVSAAVAGNASVTVGQLKWKDNATTGGSGYGDYTAFSAASVNIIPLTAGNLTPTYLFHDYGLLVEFTDAAGAYTWTVTYTLTTT